MGFPQLRSSLRPRNLSGQLAGYSLSADPGTYAVTGLAAGVLAAHLISAVAGSYALTGSDATLKAGFKIAADAGSYALTGSAATPKAGYKLAADAGSYALTGSAASLLGGFKVAANAGSYALTGSDASLLYFTPTPPLTYSEFKRRHFPRAFSPPFQKSTRFKTSTGAYTLNADSGSYGLTGAVADTLIGRKVAAVPGSYTGTGSVASFIYNVPAVSSTTEVRFSYSPPRVFRPSFQKPTRFRISTPVGVTADSGSYAVTGFAATFPRTYRLTADPGSYGLTGSVANLSQGLVQTSILSRTNLKKRNYPRAFHPSLRKPMKFAAPTAYVLAADPGSYTSTGSAASLLAPGPTISIRDRVGRAWPRAFAPSPFGQLRSKRTANLLKPPVATYSIQADLGAYAVAGSQAGVTAARKITATAGAYTETGAAATLNKGFTLAANPGTYAVTGSAATPKAGRTVAANAGSYTATGVAASLNKGGTIAAVSGSYAVTGSAATPKAARSITAVAGAYSSTGSATTLTHGGTLADQGAYASAGFPVAFRVGYRLNANAGAYTLSGTAASIQRAGKVVADPGAHAIAGSAALLTGGSVTGSGSYALAGSSASLKVGRVLSAVPGAHVVTGGVTDVNEVIGALIMVRADASTILVRSDVGIIRVDGDG